MCAETSHPGPLSSSTLGNVTPARSPMGSRILVACPMMIQNARILARRCASTVGQCPSGSPTGGRPGGAVRVSIPDHALPRTRAVDQLRIPLSPAGPFRRPPRADPDPNRQGHRRPLPDDRPEPELQRQRPGERAAEQRARGQRRDAVRAAPVRLEADGPGEQQRARVRRLSWLP